MSAMEPNDERNEKLDALFREKVDQVENTARKIGLYIQDAGLVIPKGRDPMHPEIEEGTPVMVATFSVGDIAFSDRVLNPEQDSVEKEFRKLSLQAEQEKFDDLRSDLEKRLQEGKGIFDDEA